LILSLNLVLGLLLLAPGLAAFAALYHGGATGPVKSAPPAPGSILSLTIITIAALVAHLTGSAILLVQEVICRALPICVNVGFDPNPYSLLFSGETKATTFSSLRDTLLFGDLAGLTVLSFVATRRLMALPQAARLLDQIFYDWLYDVGNARARNEFILAYVLSTIESEGTVVGYEGPVGALTTNADKEITSLVLIDCKPFYLRVTRAGVQRRSVAGAPRIPRLYLDRDTIKNVAFETVRLPSP